VCVVEVVENKKDGKLRSEIERIARAKNDLGEFDSLYKEYFPRINNFVYHRVGNESEKNEIVSNVFFKAMNKLHLFRYIDSHRSSFSSWLYRIAVNEVNQYYRNRKRERNISTMYQHNYVAEPEDKPDPEVNYKILRETMQHLKEDEQNLMTLRYFQKLSIRDVSEVLHKSEGAVKVKLHRTMKKLRGLMEKEGNYEKLRN